MPADNAVVVHERKRVFTGVVNLDELVVAEREPGHDTRTQRLLSLELPEAVALFLHDTERDTASVVIVSRPLLALDGSARDTWMFELPTETVRSGETTRQAAMRVGLEDLGTRLSDSDLTPIAVYHPISTLSAQRVTIFYATQTAEMLVGPAIADRQHVPIRELISKLDRLELSSPNLSIGTAWVRQKNTSSKRRSPAALPNTLSFKFNSDIVGRISTLESARIGCKSGNILDVRDVDIWVNSENTDMEMDRFVGRSISARIRYAGAAKTQEGEIVSDTIGEALRTALGRRTHVRIGTVIETTAGALAATNNVKAIYHVATVQGVAGRGFNTTLEQIALCVETILKYAHTHANVRTLFWRRTAANSIVMPLFGTGDGGLTVRDVAPRIISAAISFFTANPHSTLRAIYISSFTEEDCRLVRQCFEERPELVVAGDI